MINLSADLIGCRRSAAHHNKASSFIPILSSCQKQLSMTHTHTLDQKMSSIQVLTPPLCAHLPVRRFPAWLDLEKLQSPESDQESENQGCSPALRLASRRRKEERMCASTGQCSSKHQPPTGEASIHVQANQRPFGRENTSFICLSVLKDAVVDHLVERP